MSLSITPTQAQAMGSLGDFLTEILPAGVSIFQAQTNRVPEPVVPDFVSMTQIRFDRLSTNVDSESDVLFAGSIAGTVMTVTEIEFGTILYGATVFGVGVADNTKVINQLTGPTGGVGTYTISLTQTVGLEALATGANLLQQSAQSNIQLDVHGPNSADNAQIIATAFRDAYAVDWFEQAGGIVVPLYHGEPRQLAFENEQSQIESRWTMDLALQIVQTVTVSQQFASEAVAVLINVDSTYPP